MCGISGLYKTKSLASKGEELVKGMLQRIRHRGPNEAGIYLDNSLAMGTVRLSIIGIETGQQPICDEEGRYSLCYNGEVYNYLELKSTLESLGYTFHTRSDTEVVLRAWQAWGTDSFVRFNGAYAFALYDRYEESLYLVRDRFGKRPLYYAQHEGGWCFSSEMKSFLALDSFQFSFDSDQLASILTLWTPLSHQSGYTGITQVPQGCFVKIQGANTATKSYFQLDFQSNINFASETEAADAVTEALHKAVRLRLRSDVEVGVYLSGGLDSSILSALVAEEMEGSFKSYSVAFDDQEFDESHEQRLMSEHIGSRHITLQINHGAIADNFPTALYHAEVPIFRTAFVPMFLLSRKVQDDGIKVVITGEGADEAFLGYNLFKETLMRSQWAKLTEPQRRHYLKDLYPYLKHYGQDNLDALVGMYEQFQEEKYFGLFSHEIRIQNGHFSRRLLKDGLNWLDPVTTLINSQPHFNRLNPVQKAQWLEFQTLLPGYLLSSQGERMGLAHGVENRCPFLDPNIVELSSAVNRQYDGNTIEKHILRKAFNKRLPEAILNKRKHPYRAPDGKAFADTNPDYLEAILSEHELKKIPALNPKFCALLTKKILSSSPDKISTKDNQAFVFLLSLALLNRQFAERKPDYTTENPPIDDLLVKRVDQRTPVLAAAL
jgi:asparagine synthase (glutamine-hydrolysing)